MGWSLRSLPFSVAHVLSVNQAPVLCRDPKARPCIRVDEGAGGFGDRDDFRVILGY